MTSVNPEISCIRIGSGPALFGLARFYCSEEDEQLVISHSEAMFDLVGAEYKLQQNGIPRVSQVLRIFNKFVLRLYNNAFFAQSCHIAP